MSLKSTASVNHTNEPLIFHGFEQRVQQISLSRFRTHCNREDVILTEAVAREDLPVYAHWLGVILVASPQVRLTFKVQYNASEIAHFAQAALQDTTNKSMQKSVIADFMREFCNLMGGYMKSTFEEVGLNVGVSLPLVTRGFDEVFSFHTHEIRRSFSLWGLQCAGYKVFCNYEIEILNPTILSSLESIQSESANNDDGSLEFL